MWSLRWDNHFKEVFWRLIYDGLPTAARLHQDRPCVCGQGPRPDRLHHFWTCPVAAAVVQVITNKLSPTQRPHLSCYALWLAVPPPGLHSGVWCVVSLAAIVAMNSARRMQAHPHLRHPLTLSSLTSHAIARFWDLLQDFCSTAKPPTHWYEGEDHPSPVPPGHPFISPSATGGWFVH